MKRLLTTFSFLILFVGLSFSQSNTIDTSEVPVWIEMMQNPKANFFETQKAFEMYWKDRTIQKGSGWKPFKRWESFMETRVDENGVKPLPGHNYQEYNRFKSKSQKGYSPQGHGNWVELGPITMPNNGTGQPNGLGRLNCVAFHPTQANTIYVGAPSGGFWRTFNGGNTWETTTDSLATLGISSIVVNHSNPSTLLMGTGDRDGNDAPGIGVMKSNDGGDTWYLSNTGMGNRVVGRMLMHPSDSNIVIAATSSGIYKSTDCGDSWSRSSPSTRHFKDLVFKPGDPTVVYAAEGGNFYRSTNTGDTWTLISSGLSSNMTRMVIGVSVASPNTVYILGVDGRVFEGFYRSTNSGVSFTLRSSTPNIMDYAADGSGTGGQGWYNLCIAVDPNNINNIYAGGVNIFKSTDGGSNWNISAHWTGSGGADDIHADQHDLVYSKLNGKLYVGNDGGLYSTSNGGSTWIDHSSGLAIAQVYKIGQSATSSKLSINGYQDNGTSVYDGTWTTEIGGDGMECIIDYSDTNYMYGALYYGDIRRSTNNGQNFYRIARDGRNGITESGAWVTPYILDNTNPSTMYIGYRNLWRSTNVKASTSGSVNWTAISSGLAGSNSNTIRVLEQSPADNDVLYFSRADNRLFRTNNLSSGSPSYTNLTSSLPTSRWPVDIEAHPINVNEVWIAQSNNIYFSNDQGASWTDISTNLPNVSINCIVYDESTSGDLYVGTDLGVYFRKDGETDWLEFNSGIPISVEVTELEIYYDANRRKSRLKAATYGRGLWESELYESPQADFSASTQVACINQEVSFTDESFGSYNTLKWTFNGAIPSTSSDRNPKVIYPVAGTYDVQLEIYSDLDSDTVLKTAYITASPSQISVSPDTAYIDLGQSVSLVATGAANYVWFPANGLNQTTGDTVIASPTANTIYYVYGDNGGSCDTAQSVIYVNPVGIGDFEATESIQLYPNPTENRLNITFSNPVEQSLEIVVTDISGKVVLEESNSNKFPLNDYQLELEGLQSGLFFVRLNYDNQSAVFRVVKE